MKTKITLLISLFILVSCTSTEKKEVEKDKVVKEQQIPDGDFIKKYSNGNLEIKGEMSNNERVGLWTAYYESGIKQSESNYENGYLHGRTASFYPSGQVRYIGYFLGNKKDGKWDFYLEKGEFDKSEMYVKGYVKK